jgi:DNA modification methylase
MKPIPLLAYPIKNSSAPNGVVLDLFGGSGSTLIACEQTDRICRMMEIDPKYASVIVRRYADALKSTAGIRVLRDGVELSFEEATAQE